MICTHCGKEIQNGITFCPYCGSTVNNAKENTKMKKHNPAKVLVSIAAVAVVAAGGWAFANRTPTIDVSKYMILSADGYNTVGKLNISFDTEKLEKDYGKQIATRFKKQMKNLKDDTYGLSSLTASLYDGYEADLFAETCATGSADKTKNLSNGDVVTYTWDDNSDEAEEAFGVKVKYSDITYTVSGLASVNTFDAFDGVDVEFSGISPDGRATVNSLPTAAEAQGLYYTLDENSGLSNGDTVTLTVSADDTFLKNHEITLSETSKTLTVSGLKEPETIDPFEDSLLNIAVEGETVSGKLNILIRGCAPHLGVTVSSDLPADDPRSALTYSVATESPEGGYAQGDVVTITATPKFSSDFTNSYILSRDSLEVSLENVPHYLSSADEVTPDLLAQLKPLVENELNSSVDYGMTYTSIWAADGSSPVSSESSASGPRWTGTASLLVDKDSDIYNGSYYGDNMLVFPYEIAYNVFSGEGSGTAVGGIYLLNVKVNADGSYDLSEVSTGTTSYYTDMNAFLAKEVNNRSEWYDITTAPFNW